MQEMRAEYKLLIGIGIIFTFILLFFLIKENYFKDLSGRYRESKLVTCTERKEQKGIKFTTHVCTIKDEVGQSYTISYPKLDVVNDEIIDINEQLGKKFKDVKKSVRYYDEKKLQLSSYQTMNFKFYSSNNIISLLIEIRNMGGEAVNLVDEYIIYNFDHEHHHVLDSNTIKKELGIDRDYSSKLRGIVVKMYLDEFRYDYNNQPLETRNKDIDESIESITYDAINNVYIDDESHIYFIMNMYNPNYGTKVLYKFTIDKNKNTTYEMVDS